jgi:hypothetical protein
LRLAINNLLMKLSVCIYLKPKIMEIKSNVPQNYSAAEIARIRDANSRELSGIRTKSHNFTRIREFFRVYTNNRDSRLFFLKTVIIRTKLDTNLRNSNLHEPDLHEFVSSFVLMITVFGKNNCESGLSV